MGVQIKDMIKETVWPKMTESFDIKNPMAMPRLEKIVVNMGVGRAIGDVKILESAMVDLAKITGQKPKMTRSKKAISNFKLREDMPIGCKVTLRRERMYEFLDRLLNICLPRIRDFNGVSRKGFDLQGNYTLGIVDHTIFPEIDTGKLSHQFGMDVTLVFNNGSKEKNFQFLSSLGMPFTKK